MIPANVALLAYIPVAFFLMADRNAARGFSLAYLLGAMFLPSNYDIIIGGFPDLDKDNTPLIGILLGTIAFHPRSFDRFFVASTDLLLVGVGITIAMSSISNDFGAYDGASQAIGFGINFVLFVLLARLHLSSPGGLRTFLLAVVITATLYAPLALWEFRMSPQIHQTAYGYFQHVFAQHMRGSFYRPIVFFYHALALGRFFAFAAFLALFPMRRDLVILFGRAGNFIWIAPFMGLIASMSYGPWMMFVLLCGGYFIIRRTHALHYVVPAIAIVWMLFALAGLQPGSFAVQQVAVFNPDRASSLDYRLEAIEEYRTVIATRPLLGWGAWEHGRIFGRATDSQMLISLLQRGYPGTILLYAWWILMLVVILRVYKQTAGTVLSTRIAAIATFLSIGIAVSVIDAALDEPLMIMVGSASAVAGWVDERPNWRTAVSRLLSLGGFRAISARG